MPQKLYTLTFICLKITLMPHIFNVKVLLFVTCIFVCMYICKYVLSHLSASGNESLS